MKIIHSTVVLHLTTIVLLFEYIICLPNPTAGNGDISKRGEPNSAEVDTRRLMPKIRVRRNDTNKQKTAVARRGPNGQLIPISSFDESSSSMIPNVNPVSKEKGVYGNFYQHQLQLLQQTPQLPHFPQSIIPFPFMQPIKPIRPAGSSSTSSRRGQCSETFCEETPNYPIDLLSQKDLNRYNDFFSEDFVENVQTRFDSPDEYTLCESKRRLSKPKEGLTHDNTWQTIINHDNYTQGVWIDECIGTGGKCKFENNFPNNLQSECKQNYVYRQLLAIDRNGQVVKNYFKFPSCCQCVLKPIHPRIAPLSPDSDRVDRR